MLKKSQIARIAAAAVAAPVLAVTFATSASASENIVSWQNDATGKCLNWGDDWNTSNLSAKIGGCSKSISNDISMWREVPVDGKYWTFKPSWVDARGNRSNLCLTSYNTLVYLEACQDGNWWQQWEEIRTNNGWKLKHRGAGDVAGYFLDTNGSRLYTEPGNAGMNQVWH